MSIYPEIQTDPQTTRWQSVWGNPAEDHWLLGSSVLLDDYNPDLAETHNWLSERIFFSMALSSLFELAASEVQLMIRPCNQARHLRQQLPLARSWSYAGLYSDISGKPADDDVLPYAQRVSEDFILSLQKAVSRLDEDSRPTHMILSYDDDTEMLFLCQNQAPELYEKYCLSKKLSQSA